MSLKWKSVKNMKSNPESIYTCSTCNNEVFCHVNYVNAEIYPCIRKQCGDATILSKKMVEYRGWKFISTIKNESLDRKVNFICDRKHESYLTYKSLKKDMGV